jgi:hypothetical protein
MSSKFFLEVGCAPLTGGLVFLFAPRRRKAPEERQAPSQAGTNTAAKMCQSYGSLKTEEKTECQCGQDVRANTFG